MKRLYMVLAALFVLITVGNVFAGGQIESKKWQEQYPEISIGVITSENESDRLARYQPVMNYLEKRLGVKVKWRNATDYAGVIQAIASKQIELANFGPASYSKAWLVTNGQVEPILCAIDQNGDLGYYSILIVKKDSPFNKVEDLKDKIIAFADPNSTSGYQAPRFFLTKQGYDPDKFFSKTIFSGSHENSVVALLDGTVDAAATWWNNDNYSTPNRMEEKGMIQPGQWKILWKSPLLPNDPWTVPAWLPDQMKKDLKAALLNMKAEDQEAWNSLTDNKIQGYKEVDHDFYKQVVEFVKANEANRKN